MTSLSIITTVLNDKDNIENCIYAVQNQNINNIEHIIVDGGSNDGTIKILKHLKKKNKNLKIIFRNKIGIYEGINIGIKNSKYEYIGLLNSDDFYKKKDSLKLVLNEFKRNPGLPALYSNVSIVKRNNIAKELRYFKTKQLRSFDFINGLHPPHTSLFVKKEIFKKFGYYNEKFKIAADYEFMLRVFGVHKVEIKFLNKTLVTMRSGGTSTKNLKNIAFSNYEVYKAFKINKLKINLKVVYNKIIKKIFQIRLSII